MGSGEVPDPIRYWINSIPTQECALFDSLESLRRGNVLRDIMHHVTGGQSIAYTSTTYSGLVRSAVYYLVEQLGWTQLPLPLQAPSALEALSSGEKDVTVALLHFLYNICHPEADACCGGDVIVDSTKTTRHSTSPAIRHSTAKPTRPSGSTSPSITVIKPATVAPISRMAQSAPLHRPRPSSEPSLHRHSPISTSNPARSRSAPRKPTPKNRRSASPKRRHSVSSVAEVTSSASFVRHSACITGKHVTSSTVIKAVGEPYDIFSEQCSLSLDEMHHLLDWIASLDIQFNHSTLTTDLGNKWTNGVLLSEVAAAVCREHKELIKQVHEKTSKICENNKPMLILASTEHKVHSRAQISRNVTTALHILSTHRGISQLPDSADKLLSGSLSLWDVLLQIYRSTRRNVQTKRRSSKSLTRSRSKSPERSRDAEVAKKEIAARKRSNSIGPSTLRRGSSSNDQSPASSSSQSTIYTPPKPAVASAPKSILKRVMSSPTTTTALPEWNDSTTPTKKRTVASTMLRNREDAKNILRKSLEKAKKQPPEWQLSHSHVSTEARPLLPTITGEQQIAVRDWLRSLGIYIRDGEGGFKHPSLPATVAASLGVVPMCDDRIRNGLILCSILQVVEPNACHHTQLARHIYTPTTTLAHAKSNIERALWLFRLRKCPPIPAVYLSHPQGILEGDKNLIWGLLYEIMQAYDTSVNVAPTLTPQLSHLPANIPYSASQKRLLDTSLMQWLATLEVLPGLYTALEDVPSIMTLEASLRNGTLLCAVTAKICNKKDSKSLRSWNKSPKTMPQFVSNLRKCTAVLSRCLTMSQRYLYNGVEEDIARGEWMAILGLLQDMHRYYDRELPPQLSQKPNTSSSTSGYPYLGKPSHWPFDTERHEQQMPRLQHVDIVPQPSIDENVDINVTPSVASNTKVLPSSLRSTLSHADILPDPYRLAGGQLQPHSQDLTPMIRGSHTPDSYRGAPKPLSLRVQAAISRTTPAPAISGDTLEEDVPPPPPPIPKTTPKATPSRPYDDSYSVSSTPPSAPLIRTKITTLLHQHHAKGAVAAFQWLTSLQLPFALPLEVREPGKHIVIPAFGDGVLFCKLLQFLERSSGIPGVVLTPKTRAHRLQNIRKALDLLTRHKHVPLSILAYEDDLLEGRADAVVDVLLKMKEVYKNRRNWKAMR